MYLNPNQEKGRNVYRAAWFIVGILIISCIIAWFMVLLLETANPSLDIQSKKVPFFFGLLATAGIIYSLREKLYREVEQNNVWTTNDVFFSPKKKEEQKTRDGRVTSVTIFTDVNEYTSGFHLLWPWEVDAEDVDLETDFEIPFEIKVTTKDQDVTLKGLAYAKTNPYRVANHLLIEKDATAREKRIEKELGAYIKRIAQDYCREHDSNDLASHMEKTSHDITNRFNGSGSNHLEDELSIITGRVTIEDIEYGKNVDLAREGRNIALLRAEAITAFRKKNRKSKLTDKEINDMIEVAQDEATRHILDVRGMEGSGKGELLITADGNGPKSKKKGKDK